MVSINLYVKSEKKNISPKDFNSFFKWEFSKFWSKTFDKDITDARNVTMI